MTERTVTPLGRKIVAAILGTTLVSLLLAFVLNIFPMLYSYRQNAVDKACAQADLMAASLSASVDFADAGAAQEFLATLSLVPSITGAAVCVGGGSPFAAYGECPPSVEAAVPTVDVGMSAAMIAAPIPAEQTGGVVVLRVSLAGQWDILKGYLLIGMVIGVGVLLFSFKVAGVFRRKLGDPLKQLTDAVREISRGRDYSRRVQYVSDDELGLLVSEFNAMLARVESRDEQLSRHRELLEHRVEERTEQFRNNQLELVRNNRLLLSEIKKRAKAEMIREELERINRHDLKSGLSLVIGYPELLLNEGGLSPRQEKHIKRIRAAGYRMLDMIRNHLDMFKMEKGVYALNCAQVDMVEILCELEEEFIPQLTRSGARLSIELNGREVVGDEQFILSGESPLMRTMCRNLIQNAIDASTRGEVIAVSLVDTNRKCLTVTNQAPVPVEIRRRFFEKYVTSGKENGTGLGTYFAALIAQTHGAHISMKTSDDSGTTMTVVFRDRPCDTWNPLH